MSVTARPIASRRRAPGRISSGWAIARRIEIRSPRRRRSFTAVALGQHPIDLHAKVDQLRAEGVETRFQLAHVALRGDIDEIEKALDVAIEVLLVREKALAGAPETFAQPIAGHH